MARYISQHVINELKEVLRVSKLQTSNFSHIYTGTPFVYPTNEKEADEFIKERVRLWMDSWVTNPLEESIKHLERFNEDAKR